MRSYFKFLRKNKAYTIIDVIGLALSMMFIVLIGAYTWQETHIDSGQSLEVTAQSTQWMMR